MRNFLRFLAACVLSHTFVSQAGADVLCNSSRKQTALIELFTSEGCSSCPMAEAWLSHLTNEPGLWRQFVPVAFHVDYWDKLGWKDRFSSPEFTRRQRAYAATWKSAAYTPAFAVNGREARSPSLPNGAANAGVLEVARNSGALTITYTPEEGASSGWEAHVAVLANGVSSKIRGGENAGRDLRHDFVAVDYKKLPMTSAGTLARASYNFAGRDGSGGRSALAVWVTQRGELTPVQATGGWLER